MITIIASDIHLGSRHCRHAEFGEFLRAVPDDALLILNGDTFDDPGRQLPDGLADLHTLLLDRNAARGLIMLEGNHERLARTKAVFPLPAAQDSFRVPGIAHVSHGDRFDRLAQSHPLWYRALRATLYYLLDRTHRNVHIAEYAKNLRLPYRVYCRGVLRRAMEFGRREGYRYVVCGHVHQAETCDRQGVCYVNTGCWTEDRLHYACLDGEKVHLHMYRPGEPVPA